MQYLLQCYEGLFVKIKQWQKVTWENASNTCLADGAMLPKLLTAKDTSALKQFKNESGLAEGVNLWIGLKKINESGCLDSGCDGLLQWDGGNTFAFDGSTYYDVLGMMSTKMCFTHREKLVTDLGYVDSLSDKHCEHQTVLSACQYTCGAGELVLDFNTTFPQ